MKWLQSGERKLKRAETTKLIIQKAVSQIIDVRRSVGSEPTVERAVTSGNDHSAVPLRNLTQVQTQMQYFLMQGQKAQFVALNVGKLGFSTYWPVREMNNEGNITFGYLILQ